MKKAHYEYYSAVKEKDIEWLWYPYIPYGKITILQGDPGEGKSTFILNIAALLTKGSPMPDGYEVSKPQSVIYQCAEDNVSDTIKPRLLAAGANCDKIAYIVDDDAKLTLEDDRIESTIIETGARMLIVDPLQAFVGQDSDMQSAVKMRNVLRKLGDIAEKHKCAIVLIGHMNKGTGGKNLYRGLGSIDIAAIARSILMIIKDSNDMQIRYMIPVKSSLASEGSAIGFCLDRESGFAWIGRCEMDKNGNEDDFPISKTRIACSYLFETLRKDDKPVRILLEHLAELGIGTRTVETAKKQLGVKSYKKDLSWYWSLPTYREYDDAEQEVNGDED